MKYDVLVIVFAGGEGSRLHPLTDYRTKPAVPIGGKFRLIDIPLSNAANCGLRKSLILTQGKDASLIKHLKDVWYSDSRFGVFVDIISPQITGTTYKGDADAVRQVIDRIKEMKPDFILIVPGDHLLKMDYSNFIDFYSTVMRIRQLQ
jgi:glucose-1-phosphate adenylyltransferase